MNILKMIVSIAYFIVVAVPTANLLLLLLALVLMPAIFFHWASLESPEE